MANRPRILDAKTLAKKYGADSVVILAIKGDLLAGASYGKTKKECAAAGDLMNQIFYEFKNGFLVLRR